MNCWDRVKIWFSGAEPMSWCVAISPVIVAVALAYSKGVVNIPVSLLCVVIAFLFQLGVNAFKKRLNFMPLHQYAELMVMLLYGLVPVCGTVLLLTGQITMRGFLLALSMGFVATNVLIVHNYCSFQTDSEQNRRTTLVVYGQGFGYMLYILCAALALICGVLALCITDSLGETLVGQTSNFMRSIGAEQVSFSEIVKTMKFWLAIFVLEFALLQFITWRRLQKKQAMELCDVLSMTRRNVVIWAILLIILLVM